MACYAYGKQRHTGTREKETEEGEGGAHIRSWKASLHGASLEKRRRLRGLSRSPSPSLGFPRHTFSIRRVISGIRPRRRISQSQKQMEQIFLRGIPFVAPLRVIRCQSGTNRRKCCCMANTDIAISDSGGGQRDAAEIGAGKSVAPGRRAVARRTCGARLPAA